MIRNSRFFTFILILLFIEISLANPLDRFTRQSVASVENSLRNSGIVDSGPIDLIVGHPHFQINGNPSTVCSPGSSLFSSQPDQVLRDRFAGATLFFGSVVRRAPTEFSQIEAIQADRQLISGANEKPIYSMMPRLTVDRDHVTYEVAFYKLDSPSQGEAPSQSTGDFSARTIYKDQVRIPISSFSRSQREILNCQQEYQAGGGLDDYNREIAREIPSEDARQTTSRSTEARN